MDYSARKRREQTLLELEGRIVALLIQAKELAKEAGASYSLRAVIGIGDISTEIGMRGGQPK